MGYTLEESMFGGLFWMKDRGPKKKSNKQKYKRIAKMKKQSKRKNRKR